MANTSGTEGNTHDDLGRDLHPVERREHPEAGTGHLADLETTAVAQVVRDAAEIGYRHFDTAQAYGNERGVGEGLRASGIPRDELFVTTKLAAECKTYAEAKERIDGSLQALGLDHIDLMLIHSPQPWAEFREGAHFYEGNLEAWRALEEAYRRGQAARDRRLQLRAGGPRQPARQRQRQADGQPDPRPCRQHAVRPDRLQPQQGHAGRGLLAGRPWRGAEQSRRLRRWPADMASASPQLCIRYCLQLGLLPLPKTDQPRAYAQQCRRGFRDLRRGHGDAEERQSRSTDYGEASAFPVFGKKRQVEAPPLMAGYVRLVAPSRRPSIKEIDTMSNAHRFTGKVAFVTGAASGIGRATAVAFAAEGARVAILDRTEDALARDRRGGAETRAARCWPSPATCRSRSRSRRRSPAAVETFGRLDIAFNNAGVENKAAPVAEIELEEWDRILDINLRGTFVCMKHELAQMVRQGSGVVVNTSSGAGVRGVAGGAAYAASKHAIIGLTKSAALDYAKSNIRVNAVLPGNIETPMMDRFTGGDIQKAIDLEPVGRLGKPEEIAEAVLWMSADLGAFVTGAAISVDGGWSL